ncbi:SRPBCC family protein [Microscilla marina]|uniref:SRPBCC family protein n=1 Tax=Microscilla marina ATCC 23134 TaxID=313606 RepID=A1ZXF6_MICM2|nr:SRPBCC family protein [Microscilla marina]EAY24924.1 hypothetical protein M23134_04963 [Microscilla marina ATCC 23134]
MEFYRETVINASISDAWEILGNQYTTAYKWASGLKYSEGQGNPVFEGASCSNRACDTTSLGAIQEEIRVFDPQNYVLSYEVIEGFPFFVKLGQNTWKLTKEGNQTRVSMKLEMQTKGWVGKLMSPMMRMQMGGILTNAIEDFRHYVETGKPSPRKAKEIAKYAKKAA